MIAAGQLGVASVLEEVGVRGAHPDHGVELSDLLQRQQERAAMFKGRCELCGNLCRYDRRRCYAHPLGSY